MSELVLPAMGVLFLSKVQKRLLKASEQGWPGDFNPVGKLELETEDEPDYPNLMLYSKHVEDDEDERFFFFDVYQQAENAMLRIGWLTDTEQPMRAAISANDDEFFLIVGERLFLPYLYKRKGDWSSGYYSGLAVDADTLQSDELVEEVCRVFLALIEKVTSLGIK